METVVASKTKERADAFKLWVPIRVYLYLRVVRFCRS